ncbi:MAG: DUF1631 domain-containing protein [Gammaproteobacteria bacterium]|nr:DUF1631 domain-containing protein [Gammaproteobacteria bacterium]
MSAKIHSLDSNHRLQNDKYKPLIDDIKSCLNEQLSALLTHMFTSADDVLFQLAENADSNEDQNAYFDTMRLLRLEKKNIAQTFAVELREYLKPISLTENADKTDPFDVDELTLVDQEEMEEMVAISTMHSKAMNLFGDSIGHLEARLEFLAMKTSRIFAKDALVPKHICEAFQKALKPVEINTNNKLILFKMFDQQVSSQLGDLYKAINKILIAEDILPQIKLSNSSPKRTQHEPTPAPSLQENGLITEEASEQQYTSGHAGGHQTTHHSQSQPAIHQVVSQFISGDMTATGPGIPASFATPASAMTSGGTKFYNRRDVMQALSNMQNNVRQSQAEEAQVNAADFKRSLMADMGTRQGGTINKQVNQVDEKTIDFIEMLFEAIAEDGSISEIVTNLLLRLQIPIIKVAMLEQDFFIDGDHPARKVLNLIPQVGKGLAEKTEKLFIKLETIVNTLLEEFDVDIVSFQLAVNELNKLIEKEQEKTQDNEKKTQRQILQEHARQVVLAELQYHAMNKELPKTVHPLILKHWSTLMFHRYIRHGKDSAEWNDSINLLKLMINSLQPAKCYSDWMAIKNNYVELVDTIKNELYETRQNKEDIDSSIETLHQAFEDLIQRVSFSDEIIAEAENNNKAEIIELDSSEDENIFDKLPEVEAEPEAVTPMDIEAEIARDKIAQLPQNVRPGAWFEIYNGDDRAVRRLKLSVIIMEEAKLIFVDRLGVKVIEKDAAAFTEELENNKSNFIADHSAFDHALSRVITSLTATA